MREVIAVACFGCEAPGKSVYSTTNNKKNDPDRIEVKKYCSFCRKHAVHKENVRGFARRYSLSQLCCVVSDDWR